MSEENARPEIFRQKQVSEVDPYVKAGKFGNSPLLLEERNTEGPNEFISLNDFVRLLMKASPESYHPEEEFKVRIDKRSVTTRLRSLHTQLSLQNHLNDLGFDYSRMYFKLQTWDRSVNGWSLLKIDYQIMAASFLAFLNQNPDERFEDTEHDTVKLGFKIVKILKENESLDYIVVTPMLHTKTPTQGIKTEPLFLTYNEEKFKFPNIRVTEPSFLVDAISDETICFCLDEWGPTAFRACCGHCFHKECIEQWLAKNPSCPCCRKIIGPLIDTSK
jgi:hypothetical protein